MVGFNIYLRRDGRWEGRIYDGKTESGGRKYHAYFGKSKEEVIDKMAVLRDIGSNCNCSLTFCEVFTEWFQSIQHRVKESTAANYLMKWKKHLLNSMGNLSVASIKPKMIYEFIAKKQKEGLSARYITDILILIKSIFKYAATTHSIKNPMTGVLMPKKKSPEIVLLTYEQQYKLQEYLSMHKNNATLGVALAIVTGIRIGELCALQWSDIDLEKRILTVRKTMQRIQISGKGGTKLVITEPKSETSKRKIPIPECIIEFLRAFQGEDNEYICSGTVRPVEPRTMQYRFAKILKNVKLPSVHFHALRHMFATKCVKLGFDIKTLSEILGHSNVRITLEKYVHSDFSQKQEFMKRIQADF